MKNQCDICNRNIEPHLRKQNKSLCFSCLSEEASNTGAVPTFNIRQNPVHGSCAICEAETSGPNLFPSPWGFICSDCRDLCQTQTGVSWEEFKITSLQEWLVKANGRILGPFSTQEIGNKLKDNRLVALDEIMLPRGRWHLIREEEQFRGVLNEIRNKQVSKGEKNIGETTASGSFPIPDQITESTDSIDRPFMRMDKLLEGVSQKTEEPSQSLAEAPKSRDLIKSYAFEKDVRIQKEIHQKQDHKMLIVFTVIVVVGLLATLRLGGRSGENGASKSQVFQEAMNEGLRAEKTGDYRKALSYFSEARNIRPNDSELLLHLAPLTFYYDRQALQAQRMFKQILDTEQGVNYKRAGYMGMGLIALDAHELDAAHDYFVKVLNIDPESPQATANLGVVNFFKDNLHEAETSLYRALDKSRSDGAIVITMADINVAESEEPKSREKLKAAHDMLDSFLNFSHDYQQEILIEDARVLTLLNKPSEANRRIEAFLDVDPEQTDLFLRDWQLYRGRASWDQLLDTLKKVVAQLTPSPRLMAAVGLSMYRGREKLDGAQSIEQAFSQAPKDPLLMALAGWVELKLGRRETGIANIKEAALTTTKYKLPHILQARLCMEEKDYECAKHNWDLVLDLDSRSIAALHGLAEIAWEKQDAETANRWLRQGQALDPNYIPFLVLNQEIQSAAVGVHE